MVSYRIALARCVVRDVMVGLWLRCIATTPSSARNVASYRLSGAARSGRDSVLLRTVQRQMEALEERLTSQIARVQHQGDRQIDDALRQLEERMSNSEGNHPRVGRRLAELSGMIKGLLVRVPCFFEAKIVVDIPKSFRWSPFCLQLHCVRQCGYRCQPTC